MALPQAVRSSVWGLLRAEPSEMDLLLIQPTAWPTAWTWQPAVKKLPPPR